MMRQRNSTVALTIGKPIPWQTFTREKPQTDWAQSVKKLLYSLG